MGVLQQSGSTGYGSKLSSLGGYLLVSAGSQQNDYVYVYLNGTLKYSIAPIANNSLTGLAVGGKNFFIGMVSLTGNAVGQVDVYNLWNKEL